MPATVKENTVLEDADQNLPENASYELAAAEIRGTLANRGSVGSVLAEAAELDRRLMKSRTEYPESYVLGDILAADMSNRYRNGNDEGNAYMTVEDYINFCTSEQEKIRRAHLARYERRDREAARIRELPQSPELRPAAPYGVALATNPYEKGNRGKRMTVFEGSQDTELRISDRLSEKKKSLERLRETFIPDDSFVPAGTSARHVSGTISAIAYVLVFAFLMALPIGLRIVKNNETKAIAAIRSDICAEQVEIDQLRVELAIRNEAEDVERLAVEKYGMVKLDISSYEILRINHGDAIVNEEKNAKNEGAVPALLNALGIHIGK